MFCISTNTSYSEILLVSQYANFLSHFLFCKLIPESGQGTCKVLTYFRECLHCWKYGQGSLRHEISEWTCNRIPVISLRRCIPFRISLSTCSDLTKLRKVTAFCQLLLRKYSLLTSRFLWGFPIVCSEPRILPRHFTAKLMHFTNSHIINSSLTDTPI